LQQRELLQPHRSLSPGAGLAHRQPSVVERRGLLERRAPLAEIVTVEQAAVLAREAVDLLGDEALVEDDTRAFDLVLSRAAARLVEQARPRRGELRVAKRRARPRRREVELP